MKHDINLKKEQVVFGLDSVAIVKYIAGIPGGRTLNTEDFPDDVIKSGHVIVVDKDGVYSPLGYTAAEPAKGETPAKPAAYKALETGAKYAGILYRSILKEDAQAAIMIAGVVNSELLPFPLPSDFNMSNIITTKDEEA